MNQITNALRNIQRNIQTLEAWLLTHPRDYVVVSKDRLYVVQRDGQTATIAVYPQLPAIFYAGAIAYHVAAGFKAYNGQGRQIELQAIIVKEFATAAITDLKQRLIDIEQLQATL